MALCIDEKTGEVLEGGTFYSYEQINSYKNYQQEKVQRIDPQYKEYGIFYWLMYDKSIFDKLNGPDLTRVIVSATYIDYETNILIYRKNPITKSDLRSKLDMEKMQFTRFWNKAVALGVIQENKDKTITMSPQLFYKGELKKSPIKNTGEFMRMYSDMIRKIYNKTDPSYRKNLHYLFRLIPYVNRQYNYVCENPYEENIEEIIPVTLGELCNIWGYDLSHLARLRRSLWNCRINENELTINFVAHPELNQWRIFVNPRIYYAGSIPKEVMILGEFCKL